MIAVYGVGISLKRRQTNAAVDQGLHEIGTERDCIPVTGDGRFEAAHLFEDIAPKIVNIGGGGPGTSRRVQGSVGALITPGKGLCIGQAEMRLRPVGPEGDRSLQGSYGLFKPAQFNQHITQVVRGFNMVATPGGGRLIGLDGLLLASQGSQYVAKGVKRVGVLGADLEGPVQVSFRVLRNARLHLSHGAEEQCVEIPGIVLQHRFVLSKRRLEAAFMMKPRGVLQFLADGGGDGHV